MPRSKLCKLASDSTTEIHDKRMFFLDPEITENSARNRAPAGLEVLRLIIGAGQFRIALDYRIQL